MATIPSNPTPPQPAAAQPRGAQPAGTSSDSTSSDSTSSEDSTEGSSQRLTKDERKELLARIERESSRTESPERVLQRAEQAFQSGNRTQAERLVIELEQQSPGLIGLDHLRSSLNDAKKREKQRGNIHKAEEMLMRYIEERKKTAAEFALEALAEIAPEHAKLAEYKIWVRDLDKEAAEQQQLDAELAAGRLALQVGDLAVAQRHIDKLAALDSESRSTALLREELSQAAAGQAEDADIEQIKRRFEEHLAALRVVEAEQELASLSEHVVPKITLDRFNVRLEDTRTLCREQEELGSLEKLFADCIRTGQWQKARDVAQQAGKQFTQHSRPAEMFSEVNMREAEERHKESIRQGVASLEQFITEGNRGSAELALKLLKGKIEDAQLAQYQQRVQSL